MHVRDNGIDFNNLNAKLIISVWHFFKMTDMLIIVFNLLESDVWTQGNRFVIEMESSLSVCTSCQGYLEYLLELGRRKGKKIEIRLKDNTTILQIEQLKNMTTNYLNKYMELIANKHIELLDEYVKQNLIDNRLKLEETYKNGTLSN